MTEDERATLTDLQKRVIGQQLLIQHLMRHYLSTGAYYRDRQAGIDHVIGTFEEYGDRVARDAPSREAMAEVLSHVRRLLEEALRM